MIVSNMQSNYFCIYDTNKNVCFHSQEAASEFACKTLSPPNCAPAAAGLCLTAGRESSSWGSSTADMTDDMRSSMANFKHRLTDS